MNILAIETSSEACSASVLVESSNQGTVQYQLYDTYAVAPRKHTQIILDMMDEVLQAANLKRKQIDVLALSHGPGAFTGLRIAVGLIQGLALALDRPVVAVSTLEAIALQAYAETGEANIVVANDARMSEVYSAYYQYDAEQPYQAQSNQFVLKQASEAVLSKPDHPLDLPEGTWLGAGSAWAVYNDLQTVQQVPINAVRSLLPSAHYVARIAAQRYKQGEACQAEHVEPVYLRNKVADTIAEREAKQQLKNNIN